MQDSCIIYYCFTTIFSGSGHRHACPAVMHDGRNHSMGGRVLEQQGACDQALCCRRHSSPRRISRPFGTAVAFHSIKENPRCRRSMCQPGPRVLYRPRSPNSSLQCLLVAVGMARPHRRVVRPKQGAGGIFLFFTGHGVGVKGFLVGCPSSPATLKLARPCFNYV